MDPNPIGSQTGLQLDFRRSGRDPHERAIFFEAGVKNYATNGQCCLVLNVQHYSQKKLQNYLGRLLVETLSCISCYWKRKGALYCSVEELTSALCPGSHRPLVATARNKRYVASLLLGKTSINARAVSSMAQELPEDVLKQVEECREQDAVFIKKHTDHALAQELQSALERLCSERGWHEIINTGVKKDYLKDLKCNPGRQYKQFGELGKMRKALQELFDTRLDVSNELKDETIGHIERIAASFATAAKSESMYLIIRTSWPKETEETFKARWHTDGRGYSGRGKRPKLSIALNGRSTLISTPTKDQRGKYAELEQKAWDLEDQLKGEEARAKYRNKLDEFMKTNVKTLSFEDCGKAILFHCDGDGLVHSEPILDRHRIYVSFVPCSASSQVEYKKCCRGCGRPNATIKVEGVYACRRCVEGSRRLNEERARMESGAKQ